MTPNIIVDYHYYLLIIQPFIFSSYTDDVKGFIIVGVLTPSDPVNEALLYLSL